MWVGMDAYHYRSALAGGGWSGYSHTTDRKILTTGPGAWNCPDVGGVLATITAATAAQLGFTAGGQVRI